MELGLCTTYGTRTRDSSVKGRRLNLLTNAAFIFRRAKISLCAKVTKFFDEIININIKFNHKAKKSTFSNSIFNLLFSCVNT